MLRLGPRGERLCHLLPGKSAMPARAHLLFLIALFASACAQHSGTLLGFVQRGSTSAPYANVVVTATSPNLSGGAARGNGWRGAVSR